MKDRDFDDLLDGVLQEDGRAEPLSGLEVRVLARVRMQARRRWTWRVSMWSSAAAVMCLLAVVVWTREVKLPEGKSSVGSVHRELVQREGGEIAVEGGRQVMEPSAGLRPQVRRVGSVRGVAEPVLSEAEPLPKLDVFPAPSPVAEPIRRLAKASGRRGGEVVSGLVADAAADGSSKGEIKVEPIAIAMIEIEPLGKDREETGQ